MNYKPFLLVLIALFSLIVLTGIYAQDRPLPPTAEEILLVQMPVTCEHVWL